MRTLRVSKFKTTTNKSQDVALLEGNARIISQCQVKWLPISTTETPPSPSLSPYLVMSHCIFQYILLQTCGGEVVLMVSGWGFIDARAAWP